MTDNSANLREIAALRATIGAMREGYVVSFVMAACAGLCVGVAIGAGLVWWLS
jgi:hypothetical protein